MNFKRVLYSSLMIALAAAGALAAMVWLTLPKQQGRIGLAGLREMAAVSSDGLGVPTVSASSRDDAFFVLGWLHARDRLFQMELMRSKSAGRLAELFGPAALELDRRQRAYGFEQAAQAILAALPAEQRDAVLAYTGGVNAFLEQAALPPLEFLALRVAPRPWRPEDSLLVGLGMFQTLNSQEEDERMLSVMKQALPQTVFDFLTPDTDRYATVLVGGSQSPRPERPIPSADLAGLGRAALAENGVDALGRITGSNNWAISGNRTYDGRAIVADDMHLSLGVPNIWYRAALRYRENELNGVTLPGLPLLIVGSNGHVAWGFTNVEADAMDLVRLEINPANPNEYRTPEGWRAFVRRTESFKVKGGEDTSVELRNTIWGPVSPKPLLGQPVAIHWTALQETGVDLGLLDMDTAKTLEEAMAVMNRSAGPTQNAVFADERGRIAWTLLGRYPLRRGFDGTVSDSWADGSKGWDGYIAPEELPRLIDPPQGFIATANNRTLGRDYPYVIGHNQANGYRAYRISRRLEELRKADEGDLFAIQLDTASEFFEFYRALALDHLDTEALRDPELEESRRYIAAWNGRMDADSLGIGLLWRFRENLAARVFAPVVARCRQYEPDFAYAWKEMETPLRALLQRQDPAVLPDARYRDWRELILKTLAESARELKGKNGVESLDGLVWSRINRVPIRHPFSKSMPFLSPLLDMPEAGLSGCAGFCVRIVGNGHGASERMVVSPAHPEHGILHMPGGQSGHPLSSHYRDQQPAWREGLALPFLPGDGERTLVMVPAD